MKLIRFGPAGAERPGLQLPDGRRIDASAFGEDYDERFFGGDGLARLARWAADHGRALSLPRLPLREAREAVAAEEPLVPVLTEARRVDTPTVREDDAGPLLPRRPEPNEFHRITS